MAIKDKRESEENRLKDLKKTDSLWTEVKDKMESVTMDLTKSRITGATSLDDSSCIENELAVLQVFHVQSFICVIVFQYLWLSVFVFVKRNLLCYLK